MRHRISELGSTNLLFALVSQVITECLEKSEVDRHHCGQLLSSAMRSRVIPQSQFLRGYRQLKHLLSLFLAADVFVVLLYNYNSLILTLLI